MFHHASLCMITVYISPFPTNYAVGLQEVFRSYGNNTSLGVVHSSRLDIRNELTKLCPYESYEPEAPPDQSPI